MARTLILISFALAAALQPQGFAFASGGGCGQFFVHRQQVNAYAVPTLHYAPAVYYAAGRDIEAEALAEKVAKLVLGKLESRLTQPTRVEATASPLAEHCAKCHSGAAPKGGIVIDGSTPLLCGQITGSLRQIASDAMPKDHKLTPDQKGALMQALLDLEAKEPEQIAAPRPEPHGVLK
jgi:hypothetical protein